MNELKAIVDAYDRWSRERLPLALATIVNVHGSAYRRPGARMLVAPSGTVGGLSAGCLEQDVAERSREVLHSGRPAVVRYDTTAEADLIWGLGLGCNGMVEVLIEPLEADRRNPSLAFLAMLLSGHRAGAMATVFRTQGPAAVALGTRLFRPPVESGNGSQLDSRLAQVIGRDLEEALRGGAPPGVKQYSPSTTRIDVLLEVIRPPISLVIFGGGLDVVPLGRLASQLGWGVTMVVERPGLAAPERLPWAESVVVADPDDGIPVTLHERTACVIMTHNYRADRALLRRLAGSAAGYLGILGPRARTEGLLDELPRGRAARERLYTPIGLDLGAETPAEIALAVLAEIQAVFAGRGAGFLKDQPGWIHPRPEGSTMQTTSADAGRGKV